MKRPSALMTPGLMALVAIASPYASADDSGWYVGANIGLSKAKIDDPRITSSLLGAGFTTTSIADDDRHLGYKVFGGYQFNPYFAVESGYFDLGRFGFTATTLPPGTLRGDIKLKGINFDLVGRLPITEQFSAFGRVGVNYAEAKDTFVGTGAVNVLPPNGNRRNRAANVKFGAGLEYDFVPSFGMRVEAERYRVDDALYNRGDVDLFSAGLIYRFGENTPPPRPVARAPAEYVAPPPPPPPEQQAPPSQPRSLPPMPPPPPVKRAVTFSADSLFDFDKSTIRPAGKQSLDTFAADLRGTTFDDIIVTGHTDRIGSHAYNMALSTRRAEAVKAYLVDSAGIPANKISATGVDGSNPVTKPDECIGKAVTKKLKDCLQPDRRVDVEVSGKK